MDTDPQTVEVGPHTYLIGKLDAFAQLHVARRLAPLFTSLQKLPTGMEAKDASLEMFQPLVDALAQMSDTDVEYVLVKCLAVVQRKVPGTAATVAVWNSAAKRPQFDDVDLSVMLQLCAQVIMRSIGGFLGGLGAVLPGAPPA